MKRYIKYQGKWRRADNPIPTPKPRQRLPLVAAKPEHQAVIDLYNQGLPYREIARYIGVCIRTICRYIEVAFYADEVYQ